MSDTKHYVVMSLQGRPEPKWKKVTDPIPRPEAAKAIALEWSRGRLARLVQPKLEAAA